VLLFRPSLDRGKIIDIVQSAVVRAETATVNQCVADVVAATQKPGALSSLATLCLAKDLPLDADFIIAGPGHFTQIYRELGDDAEADMDLAYGGFDNVIYKSKIVVLGNVPDYVAYYLRTSDFRLHVKREDLGTKRQFTGNLTCDHPELNAMGLFASGEKQ
jgi:hypothetical protein